MPRAVKSPSQSAETSGDISEELRESKDSWHFTEAVKSAEGSSLRNKKECLYFPFWGLNVYFYTHNTTKCNEAKHPAYFEALLSTSFLRVPLQNVGYKRIQGKLRHFVWPPPCLTFKSAKRNTNPGNEDAVFCRRTSCHLAPQKDAIKN
jgi:hypothetical protein